MARLPYRERADLAPQDQDLLARNINLFRALVNSPGGARAFHGLGHYIRHTSTLDPRLREMAILQVGWQARAPYEWSHHIKIGKDFGVTDADIHALIDDTAGKPTDLDALTRLVLRGAREAAAGPGIAEATFAELRAQLDAASLTDLVIVISFYCAVVRVLHSLGVDVEPDYQPYLDAFPLPPEHA
jgi:alkylhydroperoxidase family enzyme